MKKILVKTPDDTPLSSSVISAIESVNQMKKKVDEFKQEIADWQKKHSSSESRTETLFEIEFLKETTGYIYPDFVLNAYSIPITASYGTTVKYKRIACYLRTSLGPNEHVQKYAPEFSLWMEICAENVESPNDYFPENLSYDFALSATTVNLSSDNSDDLKGFGRHVNNLKELGMAAIFNDDSVREEIVSALEDTLREINKKFNVELKLNYATEERIKEARSARVRSVHP